MGTENCFGFNKDTGGCRILNEQSEYCNTPKCPFYKTHKQLETEKQRIEERGTKKGMDYKLYYRY